MVSPITKWAKMNTARKSPNAGMSPRSGKPNSTRQQLMTSAACAQPSNWYGSALPTIASRALTGVESIPSQVPRSRSRTMDSAPSMSVEIITTTPESAGVRIHSLRLCGLYSRSTRTSVCGTTSGSATCRQ